MRYIQILLLLYISSTGYSQKLSTSIELESITTFRSMKSVGNNLDYGLSGLISEYYLVSENIELGLGLGYSSSPYDFYVNENLANLLYEWDIKLNTIKIPLLFRYNIKNGWIITPSFGMSIVTKSFSDVSVSLANHEVDRGKIELYNHDIEDNFKDMNSYFFETGFGKEFAIWKLGFSIQIFYLLSLNEYDFSFKAIDSNKYYKFKLRPQQIGWKLGLKI